MRSRIALSYSGVAGPRSRLGVERRRDPVQQLFPLRLIQLRRFLGRHIATAHPLGDIAQHLGLGDDRLRRTKTREIEIVVRGRLPVAFPAGSDEQRLDPCGICLREVVCTIGRRGRERDCETDDQEQRIDKLRMSVVGFARIPCPGISGEIHYACN